MPRSCCIITPSSSSSSSSSSSLHSQSPSTSYGGGGGGGNGRLQLPTASTSPSVTTPSIDDNQCQLHAVLYQTQKDSLTSAFGTSAPTTALKTQVYGFKIWEFHIHIFPLLDCSSCAHIITHETCAIVVVREFSWLAIEIWWNELARRSQRENLCHNRITVAWLRIAPYNDIHPSNGYLDIPGYTWIFWPEG